MLIKMKMLISPNHGCHEDPDVKRHRIKKRERSYETKECLSGKPLEELDPFNYDDTFCVIAKKFHRNIVFRFSCEHSLRIFGPCNTFRKYCIFLATHQAFDLIVMLTILINCIALAFITNTVYYDSVAQYHYTINTTISGYLEWTFLIIYTVEMIIKVVAKGFVRMQYSYLSNNWNCVDFSVVVIAYALEVIQLLQLIAGTPFNFDFEFLRTFRVLRAIKAISIIPGLRMIINALSNAVVQLLEVMFLTLICICCFGLMALQVYMGKLQQVCVLLKGEDASKEFHHNPNIRRIDPDDPRVDFLYAKWVNNRRNWLMREEPVREHHPCGNETGARKCPDGYECIQVSGGPNPDDGWTSFDNIFSSILSTFQLVTLDYWERLYELVLSSVGHWAVVFFVLVVFLGSFYLMNLLLAVVSRSYEAELRKSEEQPLTTQQKLTVHRSDSTFSIAGILELDLALLTSHTPKSRAQKEAVARAKLKATLDGQTEEEKEARMAATGNLAHAIWSVLGRTVSGKLPTQKRGEAMKLPQTYQSTLPEEPIHIGVDHEHDEVDPEPTDDETDFRYEFTQADLDAAEAATEVHTVVARKSAEVIVSSLETLSSTSTEKDPTKKPKIHCVMPWTRNVETEMVVFRTGKENIGEKIGERLTSLLSPVVSHDLFDIFITVCIIVNTILLSSEYYGMYPAHDLTLSYTSDIFTAIFTLECILKLTILHGEYFLDNWNRFDFLVVLISYGDLIVEYGFKNKNAASFRAVRLLRIFKLAQNWLTMKILMGIIVTTFSALWNLTILLGIVIYIFAVLGMQTVGTEYRPEYFQAKSLASEDYPRWNFCDFWHAFMIVFRVVCGEWIEPMWNCLSCYTNQEVTGWKCFILFIPILIVGNFIVLNLFLALLLSSFNTEELVVRAQKADETVGQVENLKKVIGLMMMKMGVKNSDSAFGRGGGQGDQGPNRNVRFKAIIHKVTLQNRKLVAEKAIQKYEEHHATMREEDPDSPFIKDPAIDIRDEDDTDSSYEDSDEDKKIEEPDTTPTLEPCCLTCMPCNDSCINERWKCTRLVCLRIVSHWTFEWLILLLIMASSITLCFEDVYLELEENSKKRLTLFLINNAFTAVFVIEMLLKWFGMGLQSYFTNFWTLLDVFIVLISVVTLIFDLQDRSWEGGRKSGTSFQSLKALRTLRALRPLRAISRWQGMKVVVNALLYAIPAIFNVLLVCLLFWLVFAIMGVQLFKGKFYKCIDSDTGELAPVDEIPDMTACCSNPRYSWINISPNFDNVGQAYISLFQVATFEGWMEIMTAASDIPTAIGKNPKREQTYYSYGFFVVFIVFGAFFTLNLFVGVIIDNFNSLKRKYEGNVLEFLLTPGQQRYYTAMRKLGKKKARRITTKPGNAVIAFFFEIGMSHRLELVMFAFIFMNIIAMACEYVGQAEFLKDILTGFGTLFNLMYISEAGIKLMGMRYFYFYVPWNVFDFILAVFSILDVIRVQLSSVLPFSPTLLRVVRVFRVTRVLRLIKATKGIRKLVYALTVSLPALFNIGALLALITFIYSIIGMALFKDAVIYRPLDDVFSFQTFPKAFMLLFRVMTAAGWNDILSALTPEDAFCGTHRKVLCGRVNEPACIHRGFSIFFMISYVMINYLIVINMYIAIILENFDEANRDEEIGIEDDDLEMFYSRWARYDPQATQFISFSKLSDFLACLDPPFTIPRPNLFAVVAFNLPIARGNKIHCLDILYALVRHVLGGESVDTESEEFHNIQDQMEIKFRRQFPERKLLDIISSTRIWKIQHNAAIIIQRFWRDYIIRTQGRSIKKRVKLLLPKDSKSSRGSSGGFANAMTKIGNFFHLGGDKQQRRNSSFDSPAAQRRRSSFRIAQRRRSSFRGSQRRLSVDADGSPRESKANSKSQLSLTVPRGTWKRVTLLDEIKEMNRETRKRRGSVLPPSDSAQL